MDDSYLAECVQGSHRFIFDASGSYDIDGNIISYEWDFGDGTRDYGPIVSHRFIDDQEHDAENENDDSGDWDEGDDNSLIFQIMLTVTDDDGAVATVTKEITVQ